MDIRSTTTDRARIGWFWRIVGLAAVAATTVFVPAAWAAGMFADTAGNPFEPDIEAIALAGITKGCSTTTPPNYCPADGVRRDAMAAFMRRGFGRVAYGDLTAESPASPGGSVTWTYTITPGLPVGAFAGAKGFVKTDATVSVTDEGSDPCLVAAWADVDGVASGAEFQYQTVHPQEYATIAVSSALPVDPPASPAAAARTVTIHLDDVSAGGADCSILALGNSTSTYYPFGNAGTNVLRLSSRPAPAHAPPPPK